MKSFNGQLYYDDRLFLLHPCLGTIEIEGDLVTTTIYHETAPPAAKWCVVTYRNCERYPAFGVSHFETKDHATAYIDMIEPTTPLISEGGSSSRMSREAYAAWKLDCGLGGYDYRKCYQPGGSNPRETVIQTREQFLASQQRVNDTWRVS